MHIHGWPSVWGVAATGAEIGEPASHRGTPTVVTLQPGATAHRFLGVVDTGALCSGPGIATAGLESSHPARGLLGRQCEADLVENFPVRVCPHQSSMNLFPVDSGVGIPNYSFS